MSFEARDVKVRFGGLVALDGVSVVAPMNAITGLIGPNGAGKTTFFNVCCGYQRAETNTVLLNDVDITNLSAVARARAGLGRTFQRQELFWDITVRENIELAIEATSATDHPLWLIGAKMGGKKRRREVREKAEAAMELVGLTDVADTAASQLPTGQGRLLELARCLAREPRILLLDEPSSGLDVSETAEFGELICKLVAETDVGVLLVEHDMSLVLRICHRITVLDFGKELFEGTPGDVKVSSEVQAAYLGLPAEAAASVE